MATDTATLKDFALTLFAHRAVANDDLYDNPAAARLSHVRFYNSDGDYIELPICRNYCDHSNLIFDDTGSSEADPEFTTVTQYYHDLVVTAEVPHFTKMFDVSENDFAYAPASFAVTNYELLNAGGYVVAEAADSTTGFTIAKGTRYLLRFTLRFFNDMVEQNIGENARSIVTTDGLKILERRMVHNQSPQEIGRPPLFLGVGGKGAYHISNASDGRWKFDASAQTYTAITSGNLFPTPTASGDAFVLCREGGDDIEGVQFTFSTDGSLASGSTLVWEYYNGAWTTLHGVDDGTENMTRDGIVRWSMPTDIDDDAELKSGTVGQYFRCRLTGASGWTTCPQISAVASAAPLVLRTVQTESDMQLPINRATADLVVAPNIGTTAKVSAEFGVGALTEMTRDDDGTLLASVYQAVRETGVFTRSGVNLSEAVTLGTYTAAVSGKTMTVPNTQPEPLLLYDLIDSNGKIYPANDAIVDYTVSGSNYLVTNLSVPNGTYTVTYLGKTIEPSETPSNILSVKSTVQEVAGPTEVWLKRLPENPADSDSDADTRFTPGLIMTDPPIYAAKNGEGPLSPNFSDGTTSGLTNYGSVSMETRFVDENGPKSWFGYRWHYNFDIGWPVVMARFDMREYGKLENPILVISGSGVRDKKEDTSYAVLVWSRGDPSSQDANIRETGWKSKGTSRPTQGNLGTPTLVTIQLTMDYREVGDGTVESPYIHEDGFMYVLISPNYKLNLTRELKPFDIGVKYWKEGLTMGATEAARRDVKEAAYKQLGDLSVNYIGLVTSAAGKTSGATYNFRRGVDWTYVLGDATAAWRIDGSKGRDGSGYVVTTASGEQYTPLLPTPRLGLAIEKFKFGEHPDGTDWSNGGKTGKLWLQHRPVSTAGIYVWEEGAEDRIDTTNGSITIDEVGWDSDAIWNEVDTTYNYNHLQASSGGDGAGYVQVTFDAADWSSTKFRNVGVRYLYYEAPTVTVDYLKTGGMMFARAHFSELSPNPALQPPIPDRIRIFFEVQFEHKRTA